MGAAPPFDNFESTGFGFAFSAGAGLELACALPEQAMQSSGTAELSPSHHSSEHVHFAHQAGQPVSPIPVLIDCLAGAGLDIAWALAALAGAGLELAWALPPQDTQSSGTLLLSPSHHASVHVQSAHQAAQPFFPIFIALPEEPAVV